MSKIGKPNKRNERYFAPSPEIDESVGMSYQWLMEAKTVLRLYMTPNEVIQLILTWFALVDKLFTVEGKYFHTVYGEDNFGEGHWITSHCPDGKNELDFSRLRFHGTSLRFDLIQTHLDLPYGIMDMSCNKMGVVLSVLEGTRKALKFIDFETHTVSGISVCKRSQETTQFIAVAGDVTSREYQKRGISWSIFLIRQKESWIKTYLQVQKTVKTSKCITCRCLRLKRRWPSRH